ncbi:MAG: Lrp/AsnC family transcriptional regulator, partial [Epibacterium sp.]|nr:Lrp/AsnC family transcriptional regulator [Epibacterium sp.]
MKDPLDDLDRSILRALGRDARVSWSELAVEAGVSAPTIRERVRRLQDIGVIEGFAVQLSAGALGYGLEAIVRFRPLPGKRHLLEHQITVTERIIQCDKVTGEDGSPVPEQVTEHIGSMLSHRVAPAADSSKRPRPEAAIVVEDDDRGPLIMTLGDRMNSTQRGKDGKLVQVNRTMGG